MGSTAPPPPPPSTTSKPIRLAILEADTPVPNAHAKYNGYGGVFTDLLRRAVAPASLEAAGLQLSVYHVVDDDPVRNPPRYPALDDLDAVLISGSKHSAYLDEPWINRLVHFTQQALATNGRVKVIGVCFGHQIVGRAAGVEVGVNEKGWEVSVTDIQLSDKGKEIFGLDTLKIHHMHRDIVTSYPPGAEPLGVTDMCITQGMLIPGKAITVQGHPEFTEDIMSEILNLRVETKIISEDLYKSGMERARYEHDGVKIAQAFLRFVRGEIGGT